MLILQVAPPGSGLCGWEPLAACRHHNPELFFPEGRPSGRLAAAENEARQVCADCPVQRPCLAVALARPEEHGVWGGLTYSEREKLLGRAGGDIGRAVDLAFGVGS